MQEAAGTLQVHRGTKRLLEGALRQPTHCHLTHEPNESPPQKAESLKPGRESEEKTPVLRVPGWGHAVGDLLQYSTRWCCILEITLPRGSLYVGWMPAQRCGKHTQAPFEKRSCSLQGKYGFSFLSVYSTGVNTDYEFLTGQLPVKLSKCCCFVWVCDGNFRAL